MTNETLLAEWRERFDDYSRFGLSVSSWCAAHDIPLHRFYYWRRLLALSSTAPKAKTRVAEIDWLPLTVGAAHRTVGAYAGSSL